MIASWYAMFRSFLCPYCEIRQLSKVVAGTSWQPSRAAATLQKRMPSRMVLSRDIKKGPRGEHGKRDDRKSRSSPFGGMNVTAAPRRLEDARNRESAAEQRRTRRTSTSKGRASFKQQSRDPMKALKMQRSLANISYEKRGRIRQAITERDSFEQFELLPIVKESISTQALHGMVDVSPTPIQRIAIPALLGTDEEGKGKRRRRRGDLESKKKDMQQFLLAAETGSGKTLAYLLPVVDAIKRAEAEEAASEARDAAQKERQARKQNRLFDLPDPDVDEPHPSTARPRAIILLPTAELVDQVGGVVKQLGHTVKFRSALLSSNYSGKVIRSRLFTTGGIDIVVTTPHLLSSITESDPNILSRVSHLVVDEADSLLDRGFSPITSAIIDRASPSLQQLILCSATIPRSLDSFLNKRYPDVKRLVTPKLHSIPRRVQLSVVDITKVPYQGNRDLACAQVIWDIGKEGADEGEEGRGKRIVVFVNEREKTTEVADYLKKKGIEAVALSRDSAERDTSEVLAEFTGPIAATASTSRPQKQQQYLPTDQETAISPSELPMQPSEGYNTRRTNSRHLANIRVLVTTDIASRGIDTTAVKHVILYDVPHTSIDFIHRLGRAGRMNRRGRGIVLVGKNDRRDVVREVREGMFGGKALI